MPNTLDARMKEFYEVPARTKLTRKIPVAIRLDGKAFHTFTKGFTRPWDDVLLSSMSMTMLYLCRSIQGCVFGYTQSDEITLILTDYKSLDSAAWFDYEVQKLVSVAASMATMAFNYYFQQQIMFEFNPNDYRQLPYWNPNEMNNSLGYFKQACFDARCFNIPKEEVTNLIYWRQRDAIRNSIQMTGRTYLSSKELHGLSSDQIKKVLLEKFDVDWESFPKYFQRGSACYRMDDGWTIDRDLPIFKGEDREYVERHIRVEEV